jgi:F-type H+-transporting ATPase subunit c
VIDYAFLLHFGAIALLIVLTSFGAGIGGGLASLAAIKAMNIQPSAQGDITRALLIGIALLETAGILGFVMAVLMIIDPFAAAEVPLYAAIAHCGMALGIGIPGLCVGIVSALPAQESYFAMARQPLFVRKIFTMMLMTLTLIQTPVLFAFLIAFFIKPQAVTISTLPDAIRLLCSGLCIGLGSIGPIVGMGNFVRESCRALGINRAIYQSILSTTFISLALIETPALFAMIISFMLVVMGNPLHTHDTVRICAIIGATIAIGLGTIAPALSSSRVAAAACRQMPFHPEQATMLARTSMITQGLIETAAIYALLISFLIFLL